jgi:superfamily II DNA or RNA helicase
MALSGRILYYSLFGTTISMSALLDCSADDRNIENAIAFALRKNGKSDLFILKQEQKDAIYSLAIGGRDVLAVLPTGFGKSLIFQLLPFVFDYLTGKSLKSSAIVISPLNGLICDQIEKLKSFMQVGVLQINDLELEDDNADSSSHRSIAFDDTMKSQLIFAHPEVFVDNKMVIINLFQYCILCITYLYILYIF